MPSSSEEDDRVMEILAAALQKPPAERETYVRAACEGNDDLRREITETMTWEERMGGFLRHPMVVVDDPAAGLEAGRIVDGRFEIIRKMR